MKIKQAIIVLIIIFLITSAIIALLNRERNIHLYRAFNSPNGQFVLEVYSFDSATPVMPGQSGDSPGVVLLKNKAGHTLQKCNVEMVQLVDSPEWSMDSVHVKLVFDCKLPHSTQK